MERHLRIARSQRRARNLLVDPMRQLRLPFFLFCATSAYAILCVSFAYIAFGDLLADAGLHAGDWLVELQAASLLGGVAATGAIYFGLVSAVCIIHTHRMIGPEVVFRRHVQALKSGDYGARMTLRDGDALVDLASDLNELAEILQDAEKLAEERIPSG